MLKKCTKFTFSIILIIVTCGFLYQEMESRGDEARHPYTGKLVNIGGYNLHINGYGTGNATVILEAGLALNSLDWALVQPEIAQFAKVYSYDRAGLGWSDESPHPRNSYQMVQELHSLLMKAEITPPYILVGHSLGGVNILLYTLLYPNEVTGLVFVDTVHEDQLKLLKSEESPNWNERMTSFSDPYWGRLTVPLGISRLFLHFSQINQDLEKFSSKLKETYFAKINTSKFSRTALEEDKYFEESLKQLEQLKSDVGTIPIIVITASANSNPCNEDLIWNAMQRDYLKLSTHSKQVYAEKSDHMIPWHQPEIIVEAVKELIEN